MSCMLGVDHNDDSPLHASQTLPNDPHMYLPGALSCIANVLKGPPVFCSFHCASFNITAF